LGAYLGIFLIAFATLALEVAFTRLLSVVTWYHLAFFAISTAMLGMTTGATRVYLRPEEFTDEQLDRRMVKACLGFAGVVPVSLIMLCLIPLVLTPSVMSLVALLATTFFCALPFYFAGIVTTVVLTKYKMPVGRLYASDLIGASMGCLFVILALEFVDVPSLILLCASVSVLAAISFSKGIELATELRIAAMLLFVIAALVAINTATPYGIQPVVVKGKVFFPADALQQKWNSFSRVVVNKGMMEPPQYWGPSPRAPRELVQQFSMNIDGEAGTTLRRYSSNKDIEHLKFDVTNIAYFLRHEGGACIIGVGGGRDVQSALLFGFERVTGIEINSIFIDLLSTDFREFAGLADRDEVTLVVDDARSYLSQTRDTYSIIQMSLIDTWAATGAGAFSLSENGLYTVEAWRIILDRLKDDGIFTVSRWHSPDDLGETGRVMSLAVAALLNTGVQEPSQHIALITTHRISTLILSKRPLGAADIEHLKDLSNDLSFFAPIIPGQPIENRVLRNILSANSMVSLNEFTSNESLNYSPPTDDTPYFFNMLRLNQLTNLSLLFPTARARIQGGVLTGNLTATLVLVGLILSLVFLTMATIVVPLTLRPESTTAVPILWSGAIYFSLIGAGFMLVEIALIQRLSVFLGHPVYALGILLSTLIASTGVGSFLSERLPLTRSPWSYIYPLATGTVVACMPNILTKLSSELVASSISEKVAGAVLVIFPVGILLGFFFPIGMRLARNADAGDTPWYWALNGVFGVLFSALAIFVSIYFGISRNFYIAAFLYGMVFLCVSRMQAATKR